MKRIRGENEGHALVGGLANFVDCQLEPLGFLLVQKVPNLRKWE